PPPFTVVLARCPDRDALILSQNHCIGDGVGAVRLLASILRSYAGEPDPVPDFDPLRMRDARESAARWTLGDRFQRLRERLVERRTPPEPAARIAPNGRRPDGIAGLCRIPFETASLQTPPDSHVAPARSHDT